MSHPGERKRDADEQSPSELQPSILQPEYRNSLLAAVAYLDLTNAFDFPANVWNQDPLPVFAQVLMGLDGSIAILATYFAFWDLTRSWQNVKALLQERAYLKERRGSEKRRPQIEDAWLGINFRELGWEVIDRMMMDAFMAIAGILVGTGSFMAIRGDVPAVFLASNVISGYLGNSFVAAYGLINAAWSVFMWRKAQVIKVAVSRRKSEIEGDVFLRLRKHARRHKIYALVNGLSVFVSGIASEVSSTMWQGYCVMIPCIAGSIFCNYFWRYCLGYNRTLFQSRGVSAGLDMHMRLRLLVDILRTLKEDPEATPVVEEVVATLIRDKRGAVVEGLLADLGVTLVLRNNKTAEMRFANDDEDDGSSSVIACVQAFNQCIRSMDSARFRDEERFVLELYGYYLAEPEMQPLPEKAAE